ncbi:MAG: serine/threonine-protein phosphatase [Acidobacteriia bacterium]|nr:serine/threonine-protein phosphatase [Terriglobia bacterium]
MNPRASLETLACVGASDLEREEALQIQQSLLPAETLRGPSFELAYRFSPFAEVGGDFADFFLLPTGEVGLCVGDVVGKGLTAAMYAALVSGTLRGIHKTGRDTASVLAFLNDRLLLRPVAGRYSATLYALFDPLARRLTFSNAGLPYPLLASASGCAPLGEGGLPAGLFPGASYDLHSVELAPGDAVLFATDGLHELRDRHDRDFSWEHLARIWQHCRPKPAEDALDCLLEEAGRFTDGGSAPHDDITAVALKVLG